MRYISLKKVENYGHLLALLIGMIIFFIITNGRILDPTYTDWMMQGDQGDYLIGWQFFRTVPWQLMFSANPNYGLEISNSILYSDSLPLLAFIFKLIHPMLPESFQYFGGWMLLCCVLQSYFAYLLLSRWIDNLTLRLIGAVFFVIAPIFLIRFGGHIAGLLSHWVILAALYLYFSPNFKGRSWVLLCVVITALGSFYITAMSIAIMTADLIQRKKLMQIKIPRACIWMAGTLFAVVLTIGLIGGFTVSSRFVFDAYGIYRLNLLAPFNAANQWSYFLPAYDFRLSEWEGSAYLGTGILILLPIAMVFSWRWGSQKNFDEHRYYLTPLMVVSGLFLVYAVTNRPAIGVVDLFNLPLPQWLRDIGNTFRASGRFVWPIIYLIYLWVLVVIARHLRARMAIILCSVMLLVQIVESTKVFKSLHNQYAQTINWQTPFRSPLWQSLAQNYRNVRIVQPFFDFTQDKDWLNFAEFASRYRLGINSGYFARVDLPKYQNALIKSVRNTLLGEYHLDSLYFFSDDTLWQWAVQSASEDDVLGTVDQYRFLAPRAKHCAQCMEAIAQIGDELQKPTNQSLVYGGEEVQCAMNENSRFNLVNWIPQPDACLMQDRFSAMAVHYVPPITDDLKLTMTLQSFFTQFQPHQSVNIFVNKQQLAKVDFTPTNPLQTIELSIPKNLAVQYGNNLQIVFELTTSPINAYLPTLRRSFPISIALYRWQIQLASGKNVFPRATQKSN